PLISSCPPQYCPFDVSNAGAAFHFDGRLSRVTEELRLSGSMFQRMDWLLGGFYSHESDPQNDPIYAADLNTGQILGLYYRYYFPGTPPTFEQYAAFANLTYHFTDRFSLQVGGRQNHDSLLVKAVTAGPFAAQYLGGSPSAAPPEEAKSNTFTYLVTP